MTNKPTTAALTVDVDQGHVLHAYDRAPSDGATRLTVLWHHGTPNVGAPPEPLFDAADRLGVRWVSYDRPGYGGSTARPGRDIGSAARDAEVVADALGIDRFVVMGHSGGSMHALACAAALRDRVVAAAGVASLAPFDAVGLDWFHGMSPAGEGSLRAAAAGRTAKEAHEASATDEDPGFVPADWEALQGAWGWFHTVVGPALANGPGPLIDDDLAYVAPWGFDPAAIRQPVLLVHGTADRVVPSSHGEWLARRIPSAELWLAPDEGHISVLDHAEAALEWLANVASGVSRDPDR